MGSPFSKSKKKKSINDNGPLVIAPPSASSESDPNNNIKIQTKIRETKIAKDLMMPPNDKILGYNYKKFEYLLGLFDYKRAEGTETLTLFTELNEMACDFVKKHFDVRQDIKFPILEHIIFPTTLDHFVFPTCKQLITFNKNGLFCLINSSISKKPHPYPGPSFPNEGIYFASRISSSKFRQICSDKGIIAIKNTESIFFMIFWIVWMLACSKITFSGNLIQNLVYEENGLIFSRIFFKKPISENNAFSPQYYSATSVPKVFVHSWEQASKMDKGLFDPVDLFSLLEFKKQMWKTIPVFFNKLEKWQGSKFTSPQRKFEKLFQCFNNSDHGPQLFDVVFGQDTESFLYE
jgi:hypothetical protein